MVARTSHIPFAAAAAFWTSFTAAAFSGETKEEMPVPKEKEGFREQLERLCELFPERETISMPEACKVVGLCRDTLLQDKTFPAKKPGNRRNGKIVVPLVALARWLA